MEAYQSHKMCHMVQKDIEEVQRLHSDLLRLSLPGPPLIQSHLQIIIKFHFFLDTCNFELLLISMECSHIVVNNLEVYFSIILEFFLKIKIIMHQSVKLTGAIWLLQLVISSPLISVTWVKTLIQSDINSGSRHWHNMTLIKGQDITLYQILFQLLPCFISWAAIWYI